MSEQIPKEKLDELLNSASKKLGLNKDHLESQLKGGKMNMIMKNLNKDNAAQLQQFLDDPKKLDDLLKNPEAKALIRKLGGKI